MVYRLGCWMVGSLLWLSACGGDDGETDGGTDDGDAGGTMESAESTTEDGINTGALDDDETASEAGDGGDDDQAQDAGDDASGDWTCHAGRPCTADEGECYRPDTSGAGCGGGGGASCVPGGDPCLDGQVCSHDAPCGPECGAPCTAGSCSPGFVCALQTGVCTPLVCPDEVTCGPNAMCDRAQAALGLPGCVRKACTTNDECDGFCVNTRCFAMPGFCSPTPPA
ncbi:MAG: hypothetical protein AAF721_03730 [Myxococcota bacterium]